MPGWRGGGTSEEKMPPKARVEAISETIYFAFKQHEVLFLKPTLCNKSKECQNAVAECPLRGTERRRHGDRIGAPAGVGVELSTESTLSNTNACHNGTLCGLWRMIRDIIDPAKRGGFPSSEDAPRGEPSE